MRILLVNPNTLSSVTELVTDHVRRVAGNAAEFVPVTGRFGARYIASRAASAIAAHAALDALAEHGEGCDAVYLACFGDPGLAALKEISPVPVIGMAEASCRVAAEGRRRFAIVTGGILWGPMLTEFVASLGLADRLAAVRTIAPTGDRIASDPDAALAELAAACRQCALEDGAEVVILGGAALAGLAERIQPDVPVPVLCSVATGTRAVLAAARARSAGRVAFPAVDSIGLGPALARRLSAGESSPG
ncbi:MAG: aspartate/glutamate racemase family protein [Methylobacterium sp.]|uniref:aspartate/glutamate racemase family protein n=1 Tax=Methylobacterium sp. TaxID=409 RepID=UPI0025DDD6E6|nr:aspartate/glutamate racemase family protein [Methylobacterium sp.]MBX9930939.1 aspartate/glutamate racemase family protein [Methylobacterium sp.]